MRPDGIPNSMHGHADCLSALVTLRGARVLVDSGFHAYNCGGAWEAHFRETAAHNTARVDGRDQARHLGKMAWSNSYRARPEGWRVDGGDAWAVGAHDGYDRGPDGVTHRRAVWLRDRGYVILCDEFVGHGEHDIEINFQFAPGVPLQIEDDRRARYGDVASLQWIGAAPWGARGCEGGDAPDQGWIAPSLGVRVPAPRLTIETRTAAARTVLLTIVAPGGARGPAVQIGTDGAQGLTVTGPDFSDRIHAPLGSVERLQGDALVVVTTANGAGDIRTLRLPAPKGRLWPAAGHSA
jgi:hypothetical protein